MTLAIISHTEHYIGPDGQVVGLASTVMEINQLPEIFDAIVHVAMLHKETAPLNVLPYVSNRIKFVAIPAVGGASIGDKFNIVFSAPRVLSVIRSVLKDVDCFQFRAPTGIGVYVIPYLVLFSQKRGWFKYAGNWKQSDAPMSYNIQKWMLGRQKRKVTINGVWDHQPSHCLSFENPCLTEAELEAGRISVSNKRFDGLLDFCFVGRLEPAKGLDLLFEAFTMLDVESKKRIGTLHIIGGGAKINDYKRQAKRLDINVCFYGLIPRSDVHDLYKSCHAIVLPSKSEGFPKVIAEAMNFGCIPIVSKISALHQYITDSENGYLLSALSIEALMSSLKSFIGEEPMKHRNMLQRNSEGMYQFTYSHYNHRINNEVL